VGDRFPYYEGVIFTLLEFAGAKNVRVQVAKREGDAVTLELRWD
jgi:uncharacterized protein (TIGR02265 family)